MSKKPNGIHARIYGKDASFRAGLIRLALPTISGLSFVLAGVNATGITNSAGTGMECISPDHTGLTEYQAQVCKNGEDRQRHFTRFFLETGVAGAASTVLTEVAFGRKSKGNKPFGKVIDEGMHRLENGPPDNTQGLNR